MDQRDQLSDRQIGGVVCHAERAQPFLVGKERVRIEIVGNYDTDRPERQLTIVLR